MDGWKITSAYRHGEEVAKVYTKGPEIHIETFVTGRALTRRNVIEHLAPLIEEYGFATTRVPISETDHKLRTALGFTQTWNDDQFSYWVLTELPFSRDKICQ